MSTALERRWFAAVAEIQQCVLCGARAEQVAHSNTHRVLGQKSAPWMTARLCASCHHDIDNGPSFSHQLRREWMMRAIVQTHEALIKCGRLVLK